MPALALAQTGGSYDLSWNTIDGGGAMDSASGTFSLSGTVGQPEAGAPMIGGSFELTGGFWTVAGSAGATVSIASANPPTPAANPYQPGQPYMDVLDTGTGTSLSAGVGAPGTAPQGAIQYSPIRVTFSVAPVPAPAPGNITVSCVGGSLPCPTVAAVGAGPGANEFQLTLSAGIPPLSCASIAFSGTATGLKLQYRSHPGNLNLDNSTNTQDLLALVQALNNGSANLAANLARYNVDRMGAVNTQDLLRLVQLLNGVNTTQAFNGTIAAVCPP
jgi:hypothetical protein